MRRLKASAVDRGVVPGDRAGAELQGEDGVEVVTWVPGGLAVFLVGLTRRPPVGTV